MRRSIRATIGYGRSSAQKEARKEASISIRTRRSKAKKALSFAGAVGGVRIIMNEAVGGLRQIKPAS